MGLANTRSIELPQLGYPGEIVETARAALRTHLPQLLALRVEQGTETGQLVTRLHALMEGVKPSQPSRTVRHQCFAHRGWRGNPKLEKCLKAYGASEESFGDIEGALEDLRQFSPYGAWAIRPEEPQHPLRLRLDRNPVGNGRVTLGGGLYLKDLVGELHAILPVIACIDAEHVTETEPSGHRRTRTYVRFSDHAGRERVALEAAFIGNQLRTAILPERGQFQYLNAVRQAWWEEQLQVHPDDMPVALHTLQLLFSVLPVDTVQLVP